MKKQHDFELNQEFYDLLNKAIQYSPKERRTNESPNFCDYSDKQTHLRKSEDISGLQNGSVQLIALIETKTPQDY